MPQLKIPYAWEPESLPGGEFALRVLEHPARFKVINFHRKGKKSLLSINKLIADAALNVGTYGYIAPTQKMATDNIWNDPQMLARNCPPPIWERRNKTEKFIPFPNGSLLYVRGADEPNKLRGPNWRGVVFDEYAWMKPSAFDIIRPALLNNNGWAWFVSTPNGFDDFKAKADYARTSGDKNWAYFEMSALESGILSPEQLEEERRTMPAAFFAQEYLVQFNSNATRVFADPRKLVRPAEMPHRPCRLKVGWDLAKSSDWTVGIAVDLSRQPFQVHLLDRWQGMEWSLTKAKIEASYHRLDRPVGLVDSTGVGDPIVEDLKKSCPRLDGFKFTPDTRKRLFDNLIIVMEQGLIRLPPDEGLLKELEAFRFVEQNSGGKRWFRPEVPSSMTDDRVCALALACWELPSHPVPVVDGDEDYEDEEIDRFATC